VELVAQVEVASSDVVHLLPAQNASRGGLFLAASPDNYPQLEKGTEIRVHVCELIESDNTDSDLSDDIQVQARARVVRVEHGPAGARGFAVEFVDLDALNLTRLDALIARGKPID
jgi:hypothetical protein